MADDKDDDKLHGLPPNRIIRARRNGCGRSRGEAQEGAEFHRPSAGLFPGRHLVTAPLAITIALATWLIEFVDSRIVPLIPLRYNPDVYLKEYLGYEIGIPGLGLIVLIDLHHPGWRDDRRVPGTLSLSGSARIC